MARGGARVHFCIKKAYISGLRGGYSLLSPPRIRPRTGTVYVEHNTRDTLVQFNSAAAVCIVTFPDPMLHCIPSVTFAFEGSPLIMLTTVSRVKTHPYVVLLLYALLANEGSPLIVLYIDDKCVLYLHAPLRVFITHGLNLHNKLVNCCWH